MGAERNVRVVSSNTLLKYDKKRRKRDAPWEDVEWDELELVSGKRCVVNAAVDDSIYFSSDCLS